MKELPHLPMRLSKRSAQNNDSGMLSDIYLHCPYSFPFFFYLHTSFLVSLYVHFMFFATFIEASIEDVG